MSRIKRPPTSQHEISRRSVLSMRGLLPNEMETSMRGIGPHLTMLSSDGTTKEPQPLPAQPQVEVVLDNDVSRYTLPIHILATVSPLLVTKLRCG